MGASEEDLEQGACRATSPNFADPCPQVLRSTERPAQVLRAFAVLEASGAGPGLAKQRPEMANVPARHDLIAQHADLRALLDDATREARRLQNWEPGAERTFALAIIALRKGLAAHNDAEEALLMATQDRAGELRARRMLEEHASEHALFVSLLDRTLDIVAAHMEDLAEQLDAHMEAEERTFLSPVVFAGKAQAPGGPGLA